MNAIKLSNRVWQDPVYFIAFGFGSGLAPVAPGTWGTLAAIPVYLLLTGSSWSIYLGCVITAFLLGVYVSEKVSNDLGVHDYSGIVWDEVVGYLITMLLAPPGVIWMVIGFLLFRIFDIWKPQPIRLIDKHVQGGLGIMLDDVLAAIPAWVILQLLAWGFA
ncbi:phosphatidylglycerophosphatase A [Legionella oakridgensis]|uniref:phosphatidylglycerophosphatase A family protein n=1 Tax=Legionella oakridgensis TaxID=29423 RepID=UPI0003DE07A0|nr:phosphatidylglycerophosphatase A [Legionella oakridgensis]ETO93673.1 phosphatidylglycerophosphatase [Legionella oakridgensis RV-2-2007]